MPTVRKRYIVSGQVQDVGYRTLVKQKARKKGLIGVVRNLADGTVEIVCEGEPGAIDGFLKDIDQKTDNPSPLDIDVSNIVESPPAPAGEFKSFEVDYGKKLSFAERSTKDREEITVLGTSMANQKLNGLGQKMDRLGDKMDGVGKDVREVGQKVDSMHGDMNKRFDHMADRYDMIALSLKEAIVHMDRNAEKTDKAIEKSRKETILEVRKSHKETAKILSESRKEVAASNRELAKAVNFMIRKMSAKAPTPKKLSPKNRRTRK